MNEKVVTFNVKYEIVLYTPVFNARCVGCFKLAICFASLNVKHNNKK